jgi:hypothetical protein
MSGATHSLTNSITSLGNTAVRKQFRKISSLQYNRYPVKYNLIYLVVNTVTTDLEWVNCMERSMLKEQTVACVIKNFYFLIAPEILINILYELRSVHLTD